MHHQKQNANYATTIQSAAGDTFPPAYKGWRRTYPTALPLLVRCNPLTRAARFYVDMRAEILGKRVVNGVRRGRSG